MRRGSIAGGVCLIVLACCAVAAAPVVAKTIGKGKMTLTVVPEVNGQFVTFATSGKIKIKSAKQKNCAKSRSVFYKATDPNGQPIVLLAKLTKGNGTYLDRNTFVYDIGGALEPEEVPSQGGTYTFKAQVPKQKDLKSKDKCLGLASPTVTATVPPLLIP